MFEAESWRIGLCTHCLSALDPAQVKKGPASFCSHHCRKQAEKVRYLRGIIRDGRSADPMTAIVAFNNMIIFLHLDLAYTRPRIRDELRTGVLAQNDGLCVECSSRPATEVDHIAGGSQEASNLRGLCRTCHESKNRGPIPDDLTRGGTGQVDDEEGSEELRDAWRIALYSGEPLSNEPQWNMLRDLAEEFADIRFGWVTGQILAEATHSPGHDEVSWRGRWRSVRAANRAWAARPVLPVSDSSGS